MILRGRLPVRLTGTEEVAAVRAELESTRADLARLAAELATARAESRAQGRAGTPSRLNDTLPVAMPAEVLHAARGRALKVVDVGAQMLESETHVYVDLVAALGGRVIGFEPISGELEKRAREESGVLLLPHAIGDGREGRLHVTKFNPASSLLPPNRERLDDFLSLPEMLEVTEVQTMQTARLDDLPEVRDCSLLKIDVQGGELDVLQGGRETLRGVLAVFTEVEFVDIYCGQPLFGAVQSFIEPCGFELLDLMNGGYGSYRAADCGLLQSRMLWADALYVRRVGDNTDLSAADLAQLACIAHFIGRKYDYASHVLSLCDRRHGTALHTPYQRSLAAALAAVGSPHAGGAVTFR
jgi:FkbM family methyltransferase